ncbi:MAG TPA: outer membrane beta-barrel protein [Terriglobales bacterium]
MAKNKDCRLRGAIFFAFTLLFTISAANAQEIPRWNFNVGGGVGFPLNSTADFANNGANFVVGGGPNLNHLLGLSAEFMWDDLPVKKSVVQQLQVPDASTRQYAVTLNAIFRVPTRGRLGFYAIGGGGWYHRSGELTAPTLVPGTVCPAFWVWWGSCVSGLFPANAVLASSSSDAFGGNIGGGVTLKIGEGNLKFYSEVRYHHAAHDHIDTDVLPLTFGLRW